MNKIARFILFDILKNKIVILYTILLFIISWSVLGLDNNYTKATLSLLNVVLLVVPLVSIIFSTIYVYNSSQFIELLLSQPVPRSKVWFNLFLGLSTALIFAFLIGCGIPILLYSSIETGASLLITGVFLSIIFTSLAMLAAIFSRDRAKGIGVSIFIWMFFAIIYDGILLVLMFQFADYPIEGIMATIAAVNPIGLSRIFVLLQLDVAAMLGQAGAIFRMVFGSGGGMVISMIILAIWTLVPFLWSLILFNKKDL
ncbi:ABC transporter permease subunit [Kaistella antarctica]|uniref:ABC-type transport system involved in multi-copper enzyme maturation, permease component n=1 Tax=Kaistella antarctica TaxID=266748 RepID=A0A3S4UNY7_9FLAO|nr:ABC transporter permease subunit [Kaistella antarctica]KEY18547.1 nitrous oxide reductase [Kaistella antarctica]SEV86849.1 Cu-processing system permease protein [Kaistella antarctica]VEI01386.1 ABC-type transport system involved in multi-copper enzyme maturation, permease component [Kaistella antarctica]